MGLIGFASAGIIAPSDAAIAQADVAASLGDSYSSGEGARDKQHRHWDRHTEDFLGNGCHRSPNAWPRLLRVRPSLHFACSGAKINDVLVRGQKRRKPDNLPQLARLRAADAQAEVDTVLLTIGGNDLDFKGKIIACYVGHKCLRDLGKLDRDLDRLRSRLTAAYGKIADATGGELFVVGYPDIFPSNDERFRKCGWLGENSKRGTHEKTGVWHLQDGLDRTIGEAAREADVEFISIRDALDGHELCTENSYVNPIRPGLSSAPAHPTAKGQRLIAEAVQARIALAEAHASQSAQQPVLGSPDGLVGASGFGEYAPGFIFNGGVPSGRLNDVRWSGWGHRVARGTAKAAIYRPQGLYFPPVHAALRVSALGQCSGHPEKAYRQMRVRVPQWPGGPLGPWFNWAGWKDICSKDYDRREPRGFCGSTRRTYDPPAVFSIEAYKLSCRRARQVAQAVGSRRWPTTCARSGCSARLRRLSCKLSRIHRNETTPGDYPYPAERVWCHRRAASMTAWLAVGFD